MATELTKAQIDSLERQAEKQDREPSGMCPLMGIGGHLCTPDCAWYIKGRRSCAITVLARDMGER